MGRLAAFAVVAGALLLGAAPAGAIETTSFGIDVVEASDDRRLHIEVEAGQPSTAQLKVWNKQQEPVTLVLSVSPAQVDESGAASLGGDAEAVAWVSVEPRQVTLAAGAERVVDVRVEAPRKLDGRTKTVAVLAQPSTRDGATPAVLQRLAVTTFLEPDQDSLIASLGAYPWLAGGALLIVAAGVLRRARR